MVLHENEVGDVGTLKIIVQQIVPWNGFAIAERQRSLP